MNQAKFLFILHPSLVPKLCLGTQAKLCFESGSSTGREASFADVRSQAELGNEG